MARTLNKKLYGEVLRIQVMESRWCVVAHIFKKQEPDSNGKLKDTTTNDLNVDVILSEESKPPVSLLTLQPNDRFWVTIFQDARGTVCYVFENSSLGRCLDAREV